MEVLNVIIVAIVVASTIWVYLDATKNKIGKVDGIGGMFNVSAGAWATVTLLLWIIGFPAYLIKRESLIEQAKESPVEVSGRGVKTAVFAVIGGLWIFAVLANSPAISFPSFVNPNVALVKNGSLKRCSDHTVEEMVDSFLSSPSWEAGTSDSGIEFVNIKGGMTFHDKPVDATLQFVVNKNDETFQFQAFEMNEIPQNDFIAVALLQKMCESASR